MMKPLLNSYLSPHAARRETSGIMGAALVFLLSGSSRSETMAIMVRHMVREWVRGMLIFLGLMSQPMPAPVVLHRAFPMPPKAVALPPAQSLVNADPNAMPLHKIISLHHYNYLFIGNATLQGKPCPNAKIVVNIESDDVAAVAQSVTNADGSYAVPISIDAKDKASVDWTINAETADAQVSEVSGQQIVQSEANPGDKPILVTRSVEFLLSLAK